MYVDHTQLVVALGCLIVDDLADSLAGRTHTDDDVLCVSSTIVVERTILTTGDLGNLVHVVAHHISHAIVVGVAALAVCEEYIGVLCHTAHHRTHWRQCALAELLQCLHVHQRTKVFHVHYLYLLILMRSAETVEEVQERHAALDGSQVSHTCQVHHLLHAALSQHREARLTACHHVLVVAEDTEHVACQSTSRYVEHGRNQLTRNLVHVRNHQQETLRSGEGGSERTRVQRTVHSTGSTALRLHLLYHNSLAEHVFSAGSCPLVHVLCHGR